MDVGGLYDCLYGIWSGQATDDILDVYNTVRREKYTTIIDPVSSSNLERMFKTDPDRVLESGNDEFFNMCLRAEKDVEFAKEMVASLKAVQYDFTKHYTSKKSENHDVAIASEV